MSQQEPTTNPQVVLRRLQDSMVQRAEQLVTNLNVTDDEIMDKGRTQTSKAIEVIQSAQSLNVFVNWLRYQAARASSQVFWNSKTSANESLARGLTRSLGELRQMVVSAMPTAEPAVQDQVVMQAATRFLGYFRRSLIGAKFLQEIRLAEVDRASTAQRPKP